MFLSYGLVTLTYLTAILGNIFDYQNSLEIKINDTKITFNFQSVYVRAEKSFKSIAKKLSKN